MEVPDPSFEEALIKRARRQRRWLIVGALWVMTWGTMILGDLIRYTEWQQSIPFSAIFSLITSPFLLGLFILPIATIGRFIGNIHRLSPYRYHLTLGLPAIACFAVLVPSILSRVQPQRRFEAVTEVQFPSDAQVIDYTSTQYGLDSSFTLKFVAPEASLIRLLKETECVPADTPNSTIVSTSKEYDIPYDMGALLKLKIDWPSSTAHFGFFAY